MTILHLRSSDLYSSPERLIIGQCRFLTTFDSVCASFIRPGQTNKFLEECARAKIKCEAINESFTGDWRTIGQIREILKRHHVDLIVTHDYKSNLLGYRAAHRERIKQIAYFHGLTMEDSKVKLYNAIDRKVLRQIGQVITVSELTKTLLIQRGLEGGRIDVVPNAIDPDVMLKGERPGSLSDEPTKILGAGRFSHEKGFDLLLEAADKLNRESIAFKIYLYGTGLEEERLRQMVDKLSLQDRVEFCGFVDDIKPIMREMDFLIMPSRSEGMPVIILEAWSQKLGVVATKVGGIPLMIRDGDNGLLIEPENVDDLKAKMKQAVDHRDLTDRIGIAGYNEIVEKYSFQVQAERLRDVYTEAARQRA